MQEGMLDLSPQELKLARNKNCLIRIPLSLLPTRMPLIISEKTGYQRLAVILLLHLCDTAQYAKSKPNPSCPAEKTLRDATKLDTFELKRKLWQHVQSHFIARMPIRPMAPMGR